MRGAMAPSGFHRARCQSHAAVLRSLRTPASLTLSWVQDALGNREDDEIIRARNAALRERPADVRKFFLAQLRPIVPTQPAARATTPALRSVPRDDPYGF